MTRISLAILLVAVAWAFFRGPLWPPRTRLWDYAVFASASQLWTRGQDPYDNDRVEWNWAANPPGLKISRDVRWVRSNAPPTTLAMFAPFVALGGTAGGVAYLAASIAAMAYAIRRVGRWANVDSPAMPYLVAGLLFSVPVTLGFSAGNPVTLAVPLAFIGLDLARRGRSDLGGVAMAAAAALKVQIGLPIIAFAWLWGWRRSSVVAGAVFAVIVVIACGRLSLAGVDWWHGLKANIADTNGPGGMNDFARPDSSAEDQLELHVPLYRLTESRQAAKLLTWGVTAIAGLALLVAARRRTEGTAPLAAGALMAVALLPVYHRTYDSMALLPLFAGAIAMRKSTDPVVRGCAVAILVLFVTYCVPLGFDRLLENRPALDGIRATTFYRAFVVTHRPWVLTTQLALAIAMIWRLSRPEKSRDGTVEA